MPEPEETKDEFDFSQWSLQMDGFDAMPYQPTTRIVRKYELLNMVAFHEAGHFVFGIIKSMHSNKFRPPSGVEAYFDMRGQLQAQNIEGVCEPFWNGFPATKEVLYNDLCTFYKANKREAILDLLSILAGYATYNVFIDKESSDIFSPRANRINNTETFEVKLFDFEHAPKGRLHIHDLYRATHLFQCLGLEGNMNELIPALIEDIKHLMDTQSVNDSIRYVRNHLLKYQEVTSEHLLRMITEIENYNEKVDFNPIIMKHFSRLLEVD